METPANIKVPVFERRQVSYENVTPIFTEFNSLFPTLEIERPQNTQPYRIVRHSESTTLFDFDENKLHFSVLKDSAETTTFDTDFNKSITQDLITDEDEDFDDSFLYGVQVFEYPRKVLFSKKITLETRLLKKRTPNVTIEPYFLEDEE